MRLICLLGLTALAAAPAYAAEAPAQAAPAPAPPICTTTTTVVKQGDVVLSTNSTTKCEDAAHPAGGFNPGAVLQAPTAVLNAPSKVFDALGSGHGDLLQQKNTAGDWRVVDSRTGDVCHLTLSVRTAAAGYAVRTEGCRDELAHVGAWTYRDGGAELLRSDGGLIVRLTGTRYLLKGSSADGAAITLQR
jgi:hypothetical protein